MNVLVTLALIQQIAMERMLFRPVTSPASWVEAISTAQMEKWGKLHTDGSLSLVPGVYSTGSMHPGTPVNVLVRGGVPYGVQVYLEGVLLRSVLNAGQFNLTGFVPEGIGGLEVFSGPSATLLGAESSSGGINVLFPPHVQGLNSYVQVTEGGYVRAGAGYGGRAGDALRYSLLAGGELTLRDRYGRDADGSYGILNVQGKLGRWTLRLKGYFLEKRWEVGFKFSQVLTVQRFIQDQQQNPDIQMFMPVGVIDPNQRYRQGLAYLLAEGTSSWNGDSVNLQVYVARTGESLLDMPDDHDSSLSFGLTGEEVLHRVRSWRYGGRVHWTSQTRWGLWASRAGIEGESLETFCLSPVGFCGAEVSQDFSDERVDGWVGLEYFNRFSVMGVSAAGRIDYISRYSTVENLSGRVFLYIPPVVRDLKITLSGAISRGVRVPRMDELYFGDRANPALRPEKGLMKELAVLASWQGTPLAIQFRTMYFKNNFKDLITRGIDPSRPGALVYVNLDNGVSEGVEGVFNLEAFKKVFLKLVATRMSMRRQTPLSGWKDLLVHLKPRYIVNAYTGVEDGLWSVVAQWESVGPWKEPLPYVDENGEVHGDPVARAPFEQKGYNLLHIYARLNLKKIRSIERLSVFVKVYNLLNRKYRLPGGFPGIPRTVTSGIELSM